MSYGQIGAIVGSAVGSYFTGGSPIGAEIGSVIGCRAGGELTIVIASPIDATLAPSDVDS